MPSKGHTPSYRNYTFFLTKQEQVFIALLSQINLFNCIDEMITSSQHLVIDILDLMKYQVYHPGPVTSTINTILDIVSLFVIYFYL